MQTTERQELMTDTYGDVAKLISYMVKRFQKRFGGDYGELLSEANALFIRAYDEFDPNHEGACKFSSFVSNGIWTGLSNFRQKQLKERQIRWQPGRYKDAPLPYDEDGELEVAAPAKSRFDLSEFMSELSSDAKDLVRLLFNLPKEVEQEAQARTAQMDEQRNCPGQHLCLDKALKTTIRKYLLARGWSPERINRRWAEINTALKQ